MLAVRVTSSLTLLVAVMMNWLVKPSRFSHPA
jgi:hypothetical protein